MVPRSQHIRMQDGVDLFIRFTDLRKTNSERLDIGTETSWLHPGPGQPDETANGLSPAGISTEPTAHEHRRHPRMHSTCLGWQCQSSAYWCRDDIRQRAALGAAAITVRRGITARTRRTHAPNLRPPAASRAIELHPAQPPSLNPLPRQQRRDATKHLAQSLGH